MSRFEKCVIKLLYYYFILMEKKIERKAHNYTLEYKNWRFTLTESDSGNCFFVNIYYKDNSCSMFVHTGAKTVEEAKKRVEEFIKTELK